MKVWLICGFLGTGKDTYFLQPWTRPMWAELAASSDNPNIQISPTAKQISFAKILKEQVAKIYQIDPQYAEDATKNLPLFNLQVSPETRQGLLNRGFSEPFTFRHFCIYHAELVRQHDPTYWVRSAFLQFAGASEIVVTDFRYPNEFEFLKRMSTLDVTTIRLFRKDAGIPDATLSSEYTLANFTTDYLLVPTKNYEQELEAALQVFPQYVDFKNLSKR